MSTNNSAMYVSSSLHLFLLFKDPLNGVWNANIAKLVSL